MGAIAGIIYPSLFPVSYAVHPMLEVMEPRSSMEPQVHQYRNVEFGCRGDGAAFSPSASTWMVLDGVISNLEELQRELNQKGYNLATPLLQMEVLSAAYDCWGEPFIERLNGPFAIALFDRKKHELILARSRIGRKPLFWAQHNGYFLFGSEMKAILASGLVPQSPDVDAFTPYLFFGYLPQDYTLVAGVNRLLPGSTLHLSEEGAISTRSYWIYSDLFLDHSSYREVEMVDQLERHLLRIVKERRKVGERIGYFSCGDLGTASLAYALDKSALAPPPTPLLLPLDSLSPDEFFSDLVKVIWYLDDPIGDPETLFTWNLFKLARGRVDSLFSSAGWGEMVAAHARYGITEHRLTLSRYMSQLPKRLLYQVVLPLLKGFYRPAAYTILRHLQVDPWQVEYLEQASLFNVEEMRAVAPRLPTYFDPLLFLQRFPELHKLGSTVSAFLFLDGKTVLPDKLIPQYDRFAPVHGVKCITPYLDRFLIQFLAGIPDREKFCQGEGGLPLQKLLHERLPGPSFELPLEWINHPTVRTLFDFLARGSLVESGWISGGWIRQALSSQRLTPHLFHQLWALLVLEIWFRLFVFDPVPPSPPDCTLLEFFEGN